MKRLRVMLIDQDDRRAANLERYLSEAECDVVCRVRGSNDIGSEVEASEPDVIIIEQSSPSRDTLEGMRHLSDHNPRPVVMFVDDGGMKSIRSAVSAGVAAYVVKGLEPGRVRPLLNVAIARFEEHQRLLVDLRRTKERLTHRIDIERAKAKLMEQYELSENDAYAIMRKMAMDKNIRLPELARRVLERESLG